MFNVQSELRFLYMAHQNSDEKSWTHAHSCKCIITIISLNRVPCYYLQISCNAVAHPNSCQRVPMTLQYWIISSEQIFLQPSLFMVHSILQKRRSCLWSYCGKLGYHGLSKGIHVLDTTPVQCAFHNRMNTTTTNHSKTSLRKSLFKINRSCGYYKKLPEIPLNYLF